MSYQTEDSDSSKGIHVYMADIITYLAANTEVGFIS